VADLAGGQLRELLDDPLGGLLGAQAALADALARLAGDQGDDAVDAYEQSALRFEELGGYEAMARLEGAMHAFGVGAIGFDRPLDSMSGGEKTRAALASLIASDPDLLLLDEPSNHLDRDGIAWLEQFLRGNRGASLVVSHDRALLDAVATSVLALDEDTGKLTEYTGGYSDFATARVAEDAAHREAYERQQEMIARVQGDIRHVSQRASGFEAISVNDYQRGKSKKIARTAVVRQRKLERMLDSDERIDRPERKWGMAVSFGEAPESGNTLVRIGDGAIDVGGRRLLEHVTLDIRTGARVALIGPNGAGKTTLLGAIAGRVPLVAGELFRSPSVRIGWYTQEHEGVRLDVTPLTQARRLTVGDEGEVRAFLHQFLLGPEQVLRPAGELSYGERARLALALLAIGGANLLLLDEPMNHLDIPSREQLEEAIIGAPVAVVLVSHDRYAIERLGADSVDVTAFRAAGHDDVKVGS
jgi:ATP-binding cassette subfamily F protein 3